MRFSLLFLPLAMGCSEVIPTVVFDRLDMTSLDFERFDADFVFKVDNPNPITVGLDNYDYTLAFAGVPLLAGNHQDGFTLEAEAQTELHLPLGMAWTDAWSLTEATKGLDTIGFDLDGSFGFETPLGVADLPYSESGEFPAVRTPKFKFKALRVPTVDVLTGVAELELDLDVENEHGSMLWFDAFHYDLSMDGADVVTGLVPSLGGVDGASAETLTLPMSANLLVAGVEVLTAVIEKRPLDIGLSAQMDVQTPFGIVPLSIDESGSVSIE
jgi:LEA14-like dessication related protein